MNDLRGLWAGAAAGLLFAAGMPTADAAPARKAAARKPAAKRAPAARPAADPMAALLKDAVSLSVAPASVTLDGPRAMQRLVVTATLKDGSTLDATDRATLTLANPKLGKVSAGTLTPLADGQTRLTARLGTLTAKATEVTVTNAGAPRTVEFVNDVMPILAKAGCNNTACHGSPAGKGALKLSLFGYEPELDHVAITKGDKLVNRKDPAKSLLLQKPTGQAPHAGGLRFKPNTREYYAILTWIKEGTPGLGEFEARVKSVEVLPEQPWIPRPGIEQRLAVTAHMTDGTARDVTHKALFSSNDDAIADINDQAVVVAKRPGETAIMVRYLGQVAVSRVAVLPPWKLDKYPQVSRSNYIDERVQEKLRKLRMVPSDVCTDEEFIRRASLDVLGIIPTPEEVRAFLADRAPDKRAKLIDRLLARPEYVDLWTMRWNDTLRNNARLTRLGAGSYAQWIREQVEKNVPFDQFTHALITATGKNTDQLLDIDNLPPQLRRQLENASGRQKERIEQIVAATNRTPPNPAANFYVVSRDPLDVTSAASQIFLGVRIECARCHNHPFEKWTQTDYYGLAAFFTGVRAAGGNQAPNIVTVDRRAPGPRHPKTNEPTEPKTLDNREAKMENGTDKREVLAKWMTSPENPFFARALVNRLWGHYFGRGIVEPIDDFRVTNPPSNPELLDALAKDFIDHRYDVKHVHRVILNSRTYQQSSKPNQYNREDTSNFARFYPKRMMAEQIYDSISQATDVFLGAPAGARGRRPQVAQGPYGNVLPDGPINRVMQIPALAGRGGGGARGAAGVAQFLNTFGKPAREVVCECERSADGNIGQALALLNGDEVNDKIASPRGRVQRLLRDNRPDDQVIEELYLATVSRRPKPMELEEAATLIRSSRSRAEGVEDVMWGLLNSREFLFNH